MENLTQNPINILENCVPGYHQYELSEIVHLSYVSDSFCTITGYEKTELLNEECDKYAALIFSADKEIYDDFICSLRGKEQAKSCEYRLLKKDGSVIFVRDTITTKFNEAGVLVGHSVLTDITDVKNENNNLQFLNDTIPCGFLKYTCEKQPKITYINRQMMEFLKFPKGSKGELDYLEMYKDNIFFMVPMEERRRFSKYLNRVYSADEPIAGEMTLLRCDGTRLHVFGWVTKGVNEHGEPEFQSVCMDVTDRQNARKSTETRRYLKALSDVYDKVFEYDLGLNTVKCLLSGGSPSFKMLENIPMQMEEATEKWINSTVEDEDSEKVKEYFRLFMDKKLFVEGTKPPQITYKTKSINGTINTQSGVFIRINKSTSYYCVRTVPDTSELDILKSENENLKENIQEFASRFSDGAATFEIIGDMVTPLNGSENLIEFFGLTKENWAAMMQRKTPIREFVANSEFSYEEFQELLSKGEAEFTYLDVNTGAECRIKAICSTKNSGESAARYVMLYHIKAKSEENDKIGTDEPVIIRTFGYFDVFVGEKALAFRNKKSKELLALLVDRRGGFVSSDEAIGFLWEDEPVNPVTLSRYRKVALRLKNALEEYGISHIMETVDGNRRIVTEKVQCDLFDYLSGKEEHASLFKGSYLTNYSWGENTLAELSGDMLY